MAHLDWLATHAKIIIAVLSGNKAKENEELQSME
jgi:hypothetical protein